MKFIYSEWDAFCKALADNGLKSVTVASILRSAKEGTLSKVRFINLKHDVESSPSKALDLARIEHKYGHCATYYVQTYLMTDENNNLFAQIQNMGHEVTYHHDVIDGGNGDMNKAIEIYRENLKKFEDLGFHVVTVCQHGNSVSDFDNRDFFKEERVQELFPDQADMMVNFMKQIGRKYVYISDVSMGFKIVNDPLNEVILTEVGKYQDIGDIQKVVSLVLANSESSYVISAHPHRYSKSAFKAVARKTVFICIKKVAKLLFKIPNVKKFLFRFNSITKHL